MKLQVPTFDLLPSMGLGPVLVRSEAWGICKHG